MWTNETWTDKQYKSCKDALLIDEGGCNGLGIAKALDRAYDAFKDVGTHEMNRCPPVILILTQLCSLARIDLNLNVHGCNDYFHAKLVCERVIEEYEKSLKESVMADADSEPLENLQAAADMFDRL